MLPVLRQACLTFTFLAACCAVFLGFGIGRPHAEDIRFFAAASTAEAVNAVTARYAEMLRIDGEGGASVRPVFAASSALAKQISQGAPADLFLSASADWMDYLEDRDAIDPASRVDLLSNRLVLVTPTDSRLSLAIAPGFALVRGLDGGRLAIGDPAHVPAGIYAKAALEALGVWGDLAGRTARTANVRVALALVERGEVAAGIVYESDLKISSRVRTAGMFPETAHPPITYPLARIAGPSSPAAERFYRFLLGPEAEAIFRTHGFRALEGAS